MGAMEKTTDPGAWKRDSFAGAGDYAVDLTQPDREEILAALLALRTAGRVTPAHALGRADFPFGALGERLRAAYREVKSGRGFALLRGLPIDGLAVDDFIAAVWGVGSWFGAPLSQNAQGDLIGHVLDATAEDATPRMYRSNLELRLHTDWTAMIVLACWQQAASGGASFLTSALTVHNEIERRAPELLEPLYRGFHHHRLGEEGPGEEPVTPYRIPVFVRHNGQISVRYQRSGIAAAHRALGVALTETELAAMDLFDEVAKAPEHRLAFFLERGDMLVINNYTVMHARTKFVEHAEPERRRHLVRLWLDADRFRDVPREVHLFAVNGVPPQPGRACTFDFKKLYNDDPRATGGMPDAELGEAELRR
ncbi:MAG TPA: TauD/TfdA family dioxygenase [Burkholderiales bacterium]|nr:TauD/TfdA family dioxygenase [Burkholderiales bacterium]